MTPSDVDAPVTAGCADESDCSAPTPYCEPTSSTCVECRFSSHCAATSNVCDGQQCRAARSCQQLKTELPTLASGVYTIDVDGDGPLEEVDAYCEMTVDGGGWTLVQRTRWQWAQSQALKSTFEAWHDTTVGMPATGAYRLAARYWQSLADGQIMVAHRLRKMGGGACDALYYIGTGATLTIDPAAKSAEVTGLTAPANIVNAGVLSTTNSGPDSATCVNTNNGVAWFYANCCTTCATYQATYWTDEPHPMVSYTGTVADFFGKTETAVCGGDAIRMSQNTAMNYRGVDSMEMYLR